MPGATHPSSAHRLTSSEKLHRAVALRRAGCTLDEIVRAGCYASRQGASRALTRYLRRLREDTEAEIRSMQAEELERLDAAHRSVWPQAMMGDLDAIDRVLDIMERRSKLLGLDAPKRVQHKRPKAPKALSPDTIEQVREFIDSSE